jgi:acyl-CoA thioester hydrolase
MKRYTYTLVVPPEAVDARGDVDHVECVRWVQDAAARHSAHVGYDLGAYQALGAAFVVSRHDIDYLRGARAHDILTITTWLASTARISSQRLTEITNAGGTMMLRAETKWVWVTLATMRPGRIPPEVRKVFGVDEPDISTTT